MKQIFLFFAGLSIINIAQAATPQPNSQISQLLSQIQVNTHDTATATTKTLSKQLTTSLAAQQAIQKNTQSLAENQTTYVYGAKAGSDTKTTLFNAGKIISLRNLLCLLPDLQQIIRILTISISVKTRFWLILGSVRKAALHRPVISMVLIYSPLRSIATLMHPTFIYKIYSSRIWQLFQLTNLQISPWLVGFLMAISNNAPQRVAATTALCRFCKTW